VAVLENLFASENNHPGNAIHYRQCAVIVTGTARKERRSADATSWFQSG